MLDIAAAPFRWPVVLAASMIFPLFAVFCAGVIALNAFMREKPIPRWLMVFLLVLSVGMSAYGLLAHRDRTPLRYRFTDDALIVSSRQGDTRVPITRIIAVRVDTDRAFRRFGDLFLFTPDWGASQGGPYPYAIVRMFFDRALGVTELFITDPARMVVLQGKPNLVITPEDPSATVAQLLIAHPAWLHLE